MKQVSIKFSEKELWELMDTFAASFERDIPENESADRILRKLRKAHGSFSHATRAALTKEPGE